MGAERPRGGVLPSVIVSGIDQQPASDVYDAVDVATRAIAGLGSVEDVLQVIVDQIRPLVGARYAALGLVDASGVIEAFITSGWTARRGRGSGPCRAVTASSA